MNPDTIKPGTIVTYEDRANPLARFEVLAVDPANPWSTFTLRNVDTGETTTTDGRQRGWAVEAPPTAAEALARVVMAIQAQRDDIDRRDLTVRRDGTVKYSNRWTHGYRDGLDGALDRINDYLRAHPEID